VHKIQSEVVTVEALAEALEQEREGPVQQRIDEMTETLKGLLQASEVKLQGTFDKQIEEQQSALAETNATISEVNQCVVEHEANFERENSERDPLTQEEMDRDGITKKYGIYYDANGKPLSLTKTEIMSVVAEGNMMRYVLED
jgi:hypothetical protein